MLAGALACFSGGAVRAQPTPAPTGGDLPCKEESAVNPKDVVNPNGSPDASGFFSLFDGTFRGWFQSCKTSHSGANRVKGAVFRIGSSGGRPAIYTTERDGMVGGVMMTNRKFANYEIRFQTWPSFGNDAGVFHRTPMSGMCYRTTLGYLPGASMGGVWGEGGFTSRDFRPFAMGNTPQSVFVPGRPGNELSNWTLITRKIKATTQPNLPCPATGCTPADWNALWNKDGWNDIRIQFYGGSAAGTGTIHMKSWFKKPTSSIWVPIIQDTTLDRIAVDGRIGLQVHGGGRFRGAKGTWYRDIRWRPLDSKGRRIALAKHGAEASDLEESAQPRFSVNASMISGVVDQDYSATVEDIKGRLLETFGGKAGHIDHAFATDARGLLLLRIRTARGVESFRVVRPF